MGCGGSGGQKDSDFTPLKLQIAKRTESDSPGLASILCLGQNTAEILGRATCNGAGIR